MRCPMPTFILDIELRNGARVQRGADTFSLSRHRLVLCFFVVVALHCTAPAAAAVDVSIYRERAHHRFKVQQSLRYSTLRVIFLYCRPDGSALDERKSSLLDVSLRAGMSIASTAFRPSVATWKLTSIQNPFVTPCYSLVFVVRQFSNASTLSFIPSGM